MVFSDWGATYIFDVIVFQILSYFASLRSWNPHFQIRIAREPKKT